MILSIDVKCKSFRSVQSSESFSYGPGVCRRTWLGVIFCRHRRWRNLLHEGLLSIANMWQVCFHLMMTLIKVKLHSPNVVVQVCTFLHFAYGYLWVVPSLRHITLIDAHMSVAISLVVKLVLREVSLKVFPDWYWPLRQGQAPDSRSVIGMWEHPTIFFCSDLNIIHRKPWYIKRCDNLLGSMYISYSPRGLGCGLASTDNFDYIELSCIYHTCTMK